MSRRYDWPRARQALQRLLTNPDDTQQAFVLIDALSGNSPRWILRRLARDAEGTALLRDKPDLLVLLQDREALRRLPDGSVGRAYLEFVDSEGISAQQLVDVSRTPSGEENDFDYLRRRLRDTHDLWHAVIGYRSDLVGEAAIAAFGFAQTRNPALGLIAAATFLRGSIGDLRAQVVRAFIQGLRARWLVAVAWENLLARPLDAVRRELRLGAAPDYTPTRTAEFVATARPPRPGSNPCNTRPQTNSATR